jgi:hypothetical protein
VGTFLQEFGILAGLALVSSWKCVLILVAAPFIPVRLPGCMRVHLYQVLGITQGTFLSMLVTHFSIVHRKGMEMYP